MADSTPLRKPFTITIIGGGLAGLLLAIGLSTRGIQVCIYEAASAFSETSAGIGFGPNAVRAMTMLDPRIRDIYNTLKTENRWEGKKNTWFDFRVGSQDAPELVAELKMDGKEGGGNVLRARFMEELIKLLPEGCAVFGKVLSWMDEIDGRVKLWFEDGTTADAAAVVGCDGIRSVVRNLLLDNDHEESKAVFDGMYVYRGLLDMEIAIAAVREELAANSQVYMGRDGDLVTYPIEKGSVLNVVAFHKHTEDTWKHEKWVIESSTEELMRDFEGWGESAQRILNLLKNPQIWALFDMPHTPNYSFKRITLLGDAAHASTSHAGAGAGMAVEDAFILSETLSDPRIDSLNTISAAFAAYSAVRQPRTQRLIRHSRESGMLFQFRKPGVGDDLEKLKMDLEGRQRWIWDINLEQHLEEAKKELHEALNNVPN